MGAAKKKFASQLDALLLAALKEIAQEDGRMFQSVLEEAVRLYVDARKFQKPRAVVMAHFRASLEKNRELGKLLAQ